MNPYREFDVDFAKTFPGLVLESPWPTNEFDDVELIKKALPSPIAKYASLQDKFTPLHQETIDHFVLEYANSRHGRYYGASDFEAATSRLFEEQERSASFLGISAEGSFLVRWAPVVYFILSFELWRRVRRLPDGKIKSDKYWFAFETRDPIGLTYAYFCAAIPLIIGLSIAFMFIWSQSLMFVMFGREFSIGNLLSFKLPAAKPPGWYGSDQFAFLLGIMAPIQLFILVLITSKLVRIVRNNSR